MSKWPHVSEERKKQIFAYNAAKAKNTEMAADFQTLLSALPPGQARQLLNDETCAAILTKYGVTGKE